MKIIIKFSTNISCFCLLFFSCASYSQKCPDSLLNLNPTAEQNEAIILFNQAENLFKGKGGVKENKKYALRLYKQAAKLGNYQAQRMLASMYRYGNGVKRNLRLAEYWNKTAVSTYLDTAEK